MVIVKGPNTGSAFGVDSYIVEEPTDITSAPDGSTVIKAKGNPDAPRPAGRQDYVMVYPAGQVWHIKIRELLTSA